MTHVTIAEGRRALVVAARLVDLYGEIYLPLFERLESELLELERRGSTIDRARVLAGCRQAIEQMGIETSPGQTR